MPSEQVGEGGHVAGTLSSPYSDVTVSLHHGHCEQVSGEDGAPRVLLRAGGCWSLSPGNGILPTE